MAIVPQLPAGAATALWNDWAGPLPRSAAAEPAFWRRFWGSAAEHYPIPADALSDLRRASADYYRLFEPFPDAAACLKELRAVGLRLAVLTNFELPSIARTLRHARLNPAWFDVLLSSASIGASKPDPRAYQAVTEALGLPPEACAFVDDRPENVAAAAALGMRAFLLDRKRPAGETLHSLAELPARLLPHAAGGSGGRPFTRIQHWNDRQLEAHGFKRELYGPRATLRYTHDALSLSVDSDCHYTGYTASRITEIDSRLPIADRIKRWQPTSNSDLVAEYTVRFEQADTPASMTENLIFWNAPLPYANATTVSTEAALPITAFGVSRNNGQYVAAVTQDLDMATFSGLYVQQPMPAWLSADEWHTVRVTISQHAVQIEVKQAPYDFTLVLDTPLLHPPEALGFEFSIDNEAAPGQYVPVSVGDGVSIGAFSIHYAAALVDC